MGIINSLIHFVLHIDKELPIIIHSYGIWTYVILFAIIFCETGLVVTPFLPGDSLIFAAGALAANGSINIATLFIVVWIAAIGGNMTNYQIGRLIGHKVANSKNSKFIKKEYFDKTQAFYEKHGGKTIIITRFMPIIRTFAPFVAGTGKMAYAKFTIYNLVGGTLWVSLFAFVGYFFGNLPWIKANFTYVIYAIVCISLLPAVIGVIKARLSGRKKDSAKEDQTEDADVI